jgi:hypothetical protein
MADLIRFLNNRFTSSASPVGGSLIAALIVALSAGCVITVGRPFARPRPEILVLGKTTISDIWLSFGQPHEEIIRVTNEKSVQTKKYLHGTFRLPIMDVRTMEFHFVDGVLVGYEFVSNFAEDHTNFDEAKVSQLKQGETSYAQVHELFGRPAGMQIYPLLKDPTGNAVIYSYRQIVTTTRDLDEKRVIVLLGADGIVSNVEFVKRVEPRAQVGF